MTATGERIGWSDGRWSVPDTPVVPALPGDGIGPEVWAAARRAIDAAVDAAYGDRRRIAWRELPIGDEARAAGLEALPATTVEAIRAHRVALKGPTTTPIGGGHRSLNVALRQALDLYAGVRPVRYFAGVPAPVLDPEALDVVIFRENTEDVYGGIELGAGTDAAARLADALRLLGHPTPLDAGLGIKVISRGRTRRLVRAALDYALGRGRRRATLVHKGNIMKATEGAFRDWGYELAREEFAGRVVVRADLPPAAVPPAGVVVVDERLADAMFQDIFLCPRSLDVLVAPNLNGDYLADACAGRVGGLGLAPGANLGDGLAVFEPAHGTAPDIAGRGIANPGSMILSGAMLLEHLGWLEAAARVTAGLAAVLRSGRRTADLAGDGGRGEILGTGAFADAVAEAAAEDVSDPQET